MRGILWRWLFFFGAILWISLCLADYHQKYLQKNLKQSLKNMDIRGEHQTPLYYQIVPQKRRLQPPAPILTFWKLLSIVFSVSAIVMIKRQFSSRMSTFRKKQLPVSSCSDFDLIRPPYGSFITRVPPISNNSYQAPIYHQEFHVARFEANLNAGDVKPTALTGVKIVQKKLEDLENNIATLKQRISNKTATQASTSAAPDPIDVVEPKLAPHQNYFGPVISNTDSSSSSFKTLQNNDLSPRKEVLDNLSRPVTPLSVDLTPESYAAPVTTSDPSSSDKHTTPEKSSRKSAGSSANSKEVRFHCNTFELDNDMISLKELKDSMSSSGKDLNREPRKIGPIGIAETYEKMKKELSQNENRSNTTSISGLSVSKSLINKRSPSRKSLKNSNYQITESKTLVGSMTNTSTCPSFSSRKSHEGSSKSFPMDGNSTSKMFTDSNSTSSLVSIRKKRVIKPSKLKNSTPLSTSIATYLTPSLQSTSLPQPRMNRYGNHASYSAINRRKANILKETRTNTVRIKGYDQISVSSSNDSTDSIDKFVAKILKPDSEMTLTKNSSDELSMASTSISSLTDSSSTFMSGGTSKFNSVTNSIRSILPLSHTTVSSNYSSFHGNSRNMPAGAEPLSSGESIVDKYASKQQTDLAIHSLAMNYLQNLESSKYETESHEKLNDSGSDFSIATKSVLEKYKSKTKQSSAESSHQNILEDKYWLLHW